MAVTWIDKMAVDVRGEGPRADDAVVMIHGLGGSLNAWTPLLPALARHRVVRPELPGAARSRRAYALDEATPHRGVLSIEVLADAVLRCMEFLGLRRAHVAGHSMGTLVAQCLALKAPARVRSLALFGALLEPSPSMRENMRARIAVAGREGGLFEIAEGISHAALSASSREQLPVAVAYVRDSIAAQPAEGFARHCAALAEAHAVGAERITCPVLVVNGDEDVVTPLSGARDVARRIPNARLEVLPRCGHWPMLERPAECQRALRDFLAGVRD
jgi:pimeloyl-ACP methyl ester carboxylesterase